MTQTVTISAKQSVMDLWQAASDAETAVLSRHLSGDERLFLAHHLDRIQGLLTNLRCAVLRQESAP